MIQYFIFTIQCIYFNVVEILLYCIIFLSDEILEFYNIPKYSNLISFFWVQEFAKLQKSLKYPLIELTDSHLNPNQFEKMNVSLARRIFSQNVAAVIIRLIELHMLPAEARLTAYYISLADNWFKIITNRQRAHALCKNHP